MASLRVCQTYTHLRKVVDEGQVSPLQLCAGQRRQGVGIVQLFAVVRGKQVWIQANHMGGICNAQEGTFVQADPSCSNNSQKCGWIWQSAKKGTKITWDEQITRPRKKSILERTTGGSVLAEPYLCRAWQTPALSHQISSGKRG